VNISRMHSGLCWSQCVFGLGLISRVLITEDSAFPWGRTLSELRFTDAKTNPHTHTQPRARAHICGSKECCRGLCECVLLETLRWWS